MVIHLLYGIQSGDRYGMYTDSIKSVFRQSIDKTVEEAGADSETYFLKTHERRESGDFPAIYIVRDGRQSLISYAHFAMRTQPESKTDFHSTLRDLILERGSKFGTWGENVESWAQRENSVVIKFEDLISNPRKTVMGAMESLPLPLPPVSMNRLPTFRELNSSNPLHFRSGKVNSWIEEFPRDLLQMFYEHNERPLLDMGYTK